MLGIYDVAAACIHYYDSLPLPADYTRDAAEIYVKETVKRLNAKHRPDERVRRFKRLVDSTYAKQTDGTSCGFFVCYYAEAYLTLRQSSGFFMSDAQFMNDYRRRAISVLLNVSTLHFPDYTPLCGFTGTYSRSTTQRTQVQSASTTTRRSAQAVHFDITAVAQTRQCTCCACLLRTHLFSFSVDRNTEHACAPACAVFASYACYQGDRRVARR